MLDHGPYLAGAPGAREALTRHVARSCRDTGFLVLANPGVPERMAAAPLAGAAGFFALPMEEKLALKVGEINIGYLPMGAQTIRISTIHADKRPNRNESFHIVRDRAPDDPEILAGRG